MTISSTRFPRTGLTHGDATGDCCLLKWSDVDLAGGFMSAKTAKTGVLVDIPIFELLSEKLVNGRAAVVGIQEPGGDPRLAKARARSASG